MLWTRNQFSCSGCLSCPSGLLFACLNVVAQCLGCNIHCQCMLGTAGMSGFTEGGTCSVHGTNWRRRHHPSVCDGGRRGIHRSGDTETRRDVDGGRHRRGSCVCCAVCMFCMQCVRVRGDCWEGGQQSGTSMSVSETSQEHTVTHTAHCC